MPQYGKPQIVVIIGFDRSKGVQVAAAVMGAVNESRLIGGRQTACVSIRVGGGQTACVDSALFASSASRQLIVDITAGYINGKPWGLGIAINGNATSSS